MPRSHYTFYLAFSLSLLLCQLIQPELLWQRNEIDQGQWWRLWTGNIVHTDWQHFTLNTAGLWLFAFLCAHTISIRQVALFVLISNSIVGILLYATQPHLQWYAGLSGTLYGLLALGGVYLILAGERLIGALLLVILLGKTAYDAFIGINPITDNLMQTPVIQEAHYFGLISSILFIIPAIIRYRTHATNKNNPQHADENSTAD